MGLGLSVEVTLDAVGNVTNVGLDPVSALAYTATKLGPHAVTFENGDGTSQVKINAKGDKLTVKASAPTLAAFIGSGSWSADLFRTHEPTTVAYTVGDAAGAPTIVIDSVTGGASDLVVGATAYKAKTGPKGSDASAKIDFSRNGFTKKLEIKVSVKAGGERPASLKITLSGKDEQKFNDTLAALAAVTGRSWAGLMCDGTTAIGFTYSVVDDGLGGTVAFGAATGGTATTESNKDGFTVRFDGTKTKVKVSLHQKKDLSWELKVRAKTDKCKHTPAANPTVNTSVAPGADQGHDHHDRDHRVDNHGPSHG
jgi:hypothetical protein